MTDFDLAAWPKGTPAPPGTHWSSRGHWALIDSGSVLWAIPYFVGGAFVLADAKRAPHEDWLVLPVLGPFIDRAYATDKTTSALLVFDGAFQSSGVCMALAGLLWRDPVLMRDGTGTVARVVVTPWMAAGRGGGLGLAGEF